MTAVPPSREAQGEPGSSGLSDGANGEVKECRGKDEDEKEPPKDGAAAAAEDMDEDEEEIDLPPFEFEPEVQSKLVRWSPEFPECLITLYLPMPTYMTQGAMMEAAKAALNREKQLPDMRVAAGSRVVIKVRQAELKSWIGERKWFVLENEEAKSFRGIWCLPPRVDRPEKVKDSTFTIQIKGIGSLTMEDAHRMLEKRDNMIASTQNELASVNLKFAEARSRLHSVKRGFTERMLVNRKAAEVMQNELDEAMKTNAELAYRISWMKQELVDTINNLDIRLANQNDRHTAVIAEMKRLTTETDQTTNYQLNHLITENGILKEKNDNLQWEYDSLEKSCDGWEGQIKRVESQRDSARLELSTLRAKLEAGGVEGQVKEMTTQRDSAHTDLKSLRPETTDRRPPKRKERDDENGADTLNPSMHSLTYTNMCYRLGPSRTGTGSYGSLGSCTSTGSHRPFPLLLAQLGDLYEHQLRLKRTPLARGTSIESKHLLAETVIKGEHLFAETGIKGEHLFAETEIKAKKAGWQE